MEDDYDDEPLWQASNHPTAVGSQKFKTKRSLRLTHCTALISRL